MIMLASNWDKSEKEKVKRAYNEYFSTGDNSTWLTYKEKYADFFINIKQLWESLSVEKINVYTNIYS